MMDFGVISAFEIYIFLLFTFGHFISVFIWLKHVGGGEFVSVEEYLFYAVLFSAGSFYIVLHFIALLGGISLVKGVVSIAILHGYLWQHFSKIHSFRIGKVNKQYSITLIDIIGLILISAVIGQWLMLACQDDTVSGFDALHYHLPYMANFAAGEPLLGLVPTPHVYPMSYSLLGAWFFLGVDSPLFIDWLNIPAFALIVVSFSLLFKILTNRSGFVWAFLVVLIAFSSRLLEMGEKISADLSNSSAYIALFTVLTSIAGKGRLDRLEWFGLSFSIGLVIGTKSLGLPLVLITIMSFLMLRVIGFFEFKIVKPEMKFVLLYTAVFFFVGGIWLFRNWYLYGSPIAPAGISIFGFQLFPGVDIGKYNYYLSVLKDIRDIPNYNFLYNLYSASQTWYGKNYLIIYAFSGMLFFDSFLSWRCDGRTLINAKNKIAIKYGLLILYLSSFFAQGYLLMRSPWSSLSIANGAPVRYILPVALCSFPLFFSFVIPNGAKASKVDYPGWIGILCLLAINIYLYFDSPFNGTGLVRYPSLPWILLASIPFIAWGLSAYAFPKLNTIHWLAGFLLVLGFLYGNILVKFYQISVKSKLSFEHDIDWYTSNKTVDNEYDEILLTMNELEKRKDFPCDGKRFFLLTRFDFPMYLLEPDYANRVFDIHTDLLRNGCRRIGFQFEPNRYCEFIIYGKAADTTKLIEDKVADFLNKDTRIINAFSTTHYTVYQVVPRIISIDLSSLSGAKVILENGSLYKPWGGTLSTRHFFFDRGKYHLVIIGKGTRLNGINCHLTVYFASKIIHQCFLSENDEPIEIYFDSYENKLENIVIDFDNDAINPQRREDRNILLKSIVLERL